MNPQALLNVIQAEELVERLRRVKHMQTHWHEPHGDVDVQVDADMADWPGVFTAPVNPDGPEAADLIETLLSTTADLTRQLAVAREAIDDGVATLAAIRATATSDEWAESAAHFHNVAGETIQRMNAVARSLTSKEEHHG